MKFLVKDAAPPATCPHSGISKPQAFRFLNQATFGATEAEAERLIALGDPATAYALWIDEQMVLPPSTQLAYVQAARPVPPPPGFDYSKLNFQRRDIWFQNSVRGSDQLRQRVAWALSQILVTSQVSLANRYPLGLADYHEVWVIDAEFRAPAGERPDPVCFVGREYRRTSAVKTFTAWATAPTTKLRHIVYRLFRNEIGASSNWAGL
jgi:hypothetical protein